MGQIFNRSYLKQYRRDLRKNLTPAEATLWLALKNKQIDGRRFRRQFSIGNYIVDFYCPAEKLIIELDGAQHFTNSGSNADSERDEYFVSLGLTVIRFENKEVYKNMEGVIDEIKKAFKNKDEVLPLRPVDTSP